MKEFSKKITADNLSIIAGQCKELEKNCSDVCPLFSEAFNYNFDAEEIFGLLCDIENSVIMIRQCTQEMASLRWLRPEDFTNKSTYKLAQEIPEKVRAKEQRS